MSHDATNWAIKQRGLPPSAKIVLWHLCDRFHPDNGCFPAQDTLANDCEISRSGLNNQLEILENAGLIRREKRHVEGSNRRRSSRYRLAFEAGFEAKNGCGNHAENGCETGESHVQNLDMDTDKAMSKNGQKPCPKNGESHVQNLDTNLVREPVSIEPVNLRESAGAENSGLEDHAASNNAASNEHSEALKGSEEMRLKGSGEQAASPLGLKGSGKSSFKAAHAAWPSFTTDSSPEAERAWFGLEPHERVTAAQEAGRYVEAARATGRRLVCSFGVYLREKRWEKLEAAPVASDVRSIEPPFGPVWCAERMERILAAKADMHFTGFELRAMADGTLDRTVLERGKRLNARAQAVALMDNQASYGQGVAVSAAARDKAGAFVPVSVGSERWLEWRAIFERNDWPWLPEMGRMPVAYFPDKDGFETMGAA